MICSGRSVFLRNFFSQRYFHTTQIRRLDPKTVEEVKIPVPWGHIAGKWWGCKQTQPIIALHGLLDNAGSYDTLLPLLDTESVLCLDLPGQGQSSHLPRGVNLHYLDHILIFRFIMNNYLKYDKVRLLSHSFGSSICFTYAGIYPDHVKQMVNMECSRLFTASSIETTTVELRKSAEGFSQDFETDYSRGFSWEETIARLYQERIKKGLPLTQSSCEIIAKRGTVKVSENKYIFSHDKRLQFSSFSKFTKKLLSEITERISCDVLNIDATNGLVTFMNDPSEWEENLMKLSKNSNFASVTVNGAHHVHLETPEVVAPVLNEFFNGSG